MTIELTPKCAALIAAKEGLVCEAYKDSCEGAR